MQALRDRTILGPIAFLGPDFTAMEWAERLQVPLDEVLLAFEILQTKPKPEPKVPQTYFNKRDQSAELLVALQEGVATMTRLAQHTGLNYATVSMRLRMMERYGMVQQVGKGPSSRWVALTDKIQGAL